MDPRIERLAKLLVHYSLKLKKGQLVKIRGEVVALPLIQALYEEALQAGAYPYTDILNTAEDEYFLKNANADQMKYISPLSRMEINKIDAYVSIWGAANTQFLSGVDPKRQAMRAKNTSSLFGTLLKRIASGSLKWVGTQYPTQADAQQAEMSLCDYEDFVYRAGHVHRPNPEKHWKKIETEQRRLVKILNRTKKLHVRAGETDLTMNVTGRPWVSCHGTENFPDGEIFTSPLEDSMEGRIHFTLPAFYHGRRVDDVRLDFKKGKVVSDSASKNEDYLKAMLNSDKGARYVGEFAIGTNYEIKNATGNTLFDEKIGGTCHVAVGAGLGESGGKNKSSIHWDMVCDLRKNGEIKADGKVIYRKGKFVI